MLVHAGPEKGVALASQANQLSRDALGEAERDVDAFVESTARQAADFGSTVRQIPQDLADQAAAIERAANRLNVAALLEGLGLDAGKAFARGIGEGTVMDFSVATTCAQAHSRRDA